VSLGVIPSDDSDGGITAQLPVLMGQQDVFQKVIKVASLGSEYVQEHLDDFIKVQDSEFYKNASQVVRDVLDGTPDLYVSREPIKIDTTTASYQNFTNGMMNNEAEAIKNGIAQTYVQGDDTINLTLNFNPTHGLLGDALESAVDKSGGTTGMAEQTGEFIREVTTARGDAGSNFAAHSQGNILTNSGVNYINSQGTYENGGFQDKSYFYNPNGATKEEIEYGLPTFAGYGSPVNKTTMEKTLQSKINGKDSPLVFVGNYTNPDDFVGEGLGWNAGDKGQATIGDKINIGNAIKLFTDESPHSNYECNQLTGAHCGDRP
jgi:filamentous hemagglutinin